MDAGLVDAYVGEVLAGIEEIDGMAWHSISSIMKNK